MLNLFFCSGTILMLLTSCTYSLNVVHTEGVANDVVDETQAPTTTADPDINVPISGI